MRARTECERDCLLFFKFGHGLYEDRHHRQYLTVLMVSTQTRYFLAIPAEVDQKDWLLKAVSDSTRKKPVSLRRIQEVKSLPRASKTYRFVDAAASLPFVHSTTISASAPTPTPPGPTAGSSSHLCSLFSTSFHIFLSSILPSVQQTLFFQGRLPTRRYLADCDSVGNRVSKRIDGVEKMSRMPSRFQLI